MSGQKNNPSQRIALMGVGNEFNGDDAAGVMIVRRLRRSLAGRANLLLVEGGLAPENQTGALRNFAPEIVVLLDAGNFGAPTGTVTMLAWQALEGFSGSTHTLPPTVLARYLVETLECQVFVIAIQVGHTEFDRPMSPEVRRAVGAVARYFEKNLPLIPPFRSPDFQ